MKPSSFGEVQIIAVMREEDAGMLWRKSSTHGNVSFLRTGAGKRKGF